MSHTKESQVSDLLIPCFHFHLNLNTDQEMKGFSFVVVVDLVMMTNVHVCVHVEWVCVCLNGFIEIDSRWRLIQSTSKCQLSRG